MAHTASFLADKPSIICLCSVFQFLPTGSLAEHAACDFQGLQSKVMNVQKDVAEQGLCGTTNWQPWNRDEDTSSLADLRSTV